LEDGQSAGIVPLTEAKVLANKAELDLVAISPRSVPPVARILDYNKYRYQLEKNARGATKAKPKQLKEMRLSFLIGQHDLETKAKQAKAFLDEGHFVRIFINLRGRQNLFPEKAKQILESFRDSVGATTEQPVNAVGKRLQLIIKPLKNA
jgi:translation initiation factor IF-3